MFCQQRQEYEERAFRACLHISFFTHYHLGVEAKALNGDKRSGKADTFQTKSIGDNGNR